MGGLPAHLLLKAFLMTNETSHELDARGLLCPEPIMLLHKAVKTLSPGEVIHMLASDPSTQRDVAKFCMFLDFSLIKNNEEGGVYHYWIQKPR